MGACSDQVEWSEDASHEPKAGNMCELSKARSMVLGLWVHVKGN